MNKKFALLALASLVSISSAASAVVFSDDGTAAQLEPAYYYTYASESPASTIDTTNVNGAKVIDYDVPMGKDDAYAGFGFAWLQKDAAKSLSAYKGVCLTYEAQHPVRLDFKQSTIKDSDYYGTTLAAAATSKRTFVAFSALKQEGWGTKVAWSAAAQTGVQFSYKVALANAAKDSKNALVLHSFILADECVTFAPNVTETFKGYNGGEIDLAEGAIHEMDMTEVFEDADGDDLTITVKIVSENNSVKLVDSTAKFDQNSVIKFTTVANPEGPATVTLTATDPTNKTATFSFTIKTSNVENDPVAKDFAIELPEDSSYKSPLSKRLSTMGFDADNDKINVVIVDEPAHGTLTMETSTVFTYVPEKDYNGTDSFTYKFVDANKAESVSNIGTCTITVTPVNDAPEVKFNGETFVDNDGNDRNYGDTLVVDEDFAAFTIAVPEENVSVTDVDGEDDIVVTAKVSGVVSAQMVNDMSGFYSIEISAVKDANGLATVKLHAGDHKITKSVVICYVKVNSVVDDPSVKDDSYTIPQDSLFKVIAKNGVLANDANPDSAEVTAVLVAPAEHGEVVLAADGSFTYKSEEGYEGEDYFGYVIAYGEADSTEMGVVTINVVYKNKAPQIVEDVLDTIGGKWVGLKEDFTSSKTYTKAEMVTWFTDDATAPANLKFTTRSDDKLLTPSIVASTGVLSIKAVKDACGDATVIVTAKDEDGATTDLEIPVSIECVNDRPVANAIDTIYVNSDSAWTVALDLNKYITDPDGDTLTYTVVAQSMVAKVDGDTLRLSANEGVRYMMGMTFAVSIKAADAATSVSTIVYITLGAPAAVKPMIAAPKATWQNAILANRGMAAIFDMQGRVMWKQKLPVSEAEVRAAASQVQGRKILQVNKQSWTIK